MGIKEQFDKLKDNWLLIALLLVVFVAMSGLGNISYAVSNFAGKSFGSAEMAYDSAGGSYYRQPGYGNGNFAPDVIERIKIKNTYISSEVKSGTYKSAESKLKSILTTSDSFLLNENVNQYDSGWKSYFSGSYQIKVPTNKYDALIGQLKDIGEVKSFNENSQDITGSYVDLEDQLSTEKARLARYQKMYDESTLVADKIQVSNLIFDEERTVQYLDRAIRDMGQKVDYSQIQLTLSEKKSEYADITFAKLSQLIQALVGSFNSMLYLLFIAAPWLAIFMIIKFFMRFKKVKK